jgi:hypothetical protein
MTCQELDARLDDYLDEALPAPDRAAIEAHLAGCPACAALLADLVNLRDRARRAPRAVPPPPAVWAAVERLATHDARRVARPSWRPWLLAAAAVLLVALSSLTTVVVVRDRDSRLATRDAGLPSLPPRLAALEADYQQAAAELVRALEREGSLSPASREALARHLAVVDAAIAEARASAAGAVPDAEAGDLLLAAHRQKLDLLERAARLLSDT